MALLVISPGSLFSYFIIQELEQKESGAGSPVCLCVFLFHFKNIVVLYKLCVPCLFFFLLLFDRILLPNKIFYFTFISISINTNEKLIVSLCFIATSGTLKSYTFGEYEGEKET
jgi:hypothetical protein